MIKINNKQINVSDIIDLLIDRMILIVRDMGEYQNMPNRIKTICFVSSIRIPDAKTLNVIKFEYLKFIKGNKDPYKRVAEFEYRDENGLPDFNKMDRLVYKRFTKKERQTEIDRIIKMINFCNNKNLDTTLYKTQLKELI